MSENRYIATEVSSTVLLGLLAVMGGRNETEIRCDEPAALEAEGFAELTGDMAWRGSSQRFAVGARTVTALRFLCEGAPVSILAVAGEQEPAPLLVSGHVTAADEIVRKWLAAGDSR